MTAPDDDSAAMAMPPLPGDGTDGASAVRTANSANGSGGSGLVTDAALVLVQTATEGTPATDTHGSSATDRKRKRNDTSGSAKAIRAWLLPPGGHPPSTTNPNPKVRKSGAVGKAVLAQDPGFDGAKSCFFF